MTYRDELLEKLFDNMDAGRNEMLSEIRLLSPDEIISKAYEIVMKEDIYILLETENLSVKDLEVLTKNPYPLQSIYDSWMRTDYNHMDILRDNLNEYIYRHRKEKSIVHGER
ncbi:MAG: DUF3848 domain-containing protein [Eubacteriaceae bacterium]|nr:DUF3848 domain-containing protein [Eubacteriaceae bacterium]